MEMEHKLLYRVNEAAEQLSISRAKVYELIYSGALASVRTDRSRRIPHDALLAYVASLAQDAA